MVMAGKGGKADNALNGEFHLAGNAVADASFVFDFDVVVVESESGEREEYEEKHEDFRVGEVAPEDG